MKVVGDSAYFAPSDIVRSATYKVLQPGQWIWRVSVDFASSTLNVKNRGFPHFGQEYCTAPVVIARGKAGAYNAFPAPRGRGSPPRPGGAPARGREGERLGPSSHRGTPAGSRPGVCRS